MSQKSQRIVRIIISLLIILLSGCGGGTGADSNGAGQNNTNTPQSPVSTGVTYSIYGSVTLNAYGLEGASVNLTGPAIGNGPTGQLGSFAFSGLPNGNYIIEPSKVGYTFVPSTQSVVINGGNITGVNFTATPTASPPITTSNYSVSGTVISNNGSVLSGVDIRTTTSIATLSLDTDIDGKYSIYPLSNGTYLMTPSKSGYTFSPANQTYTINGNNQENINFVATPITTPYSVTGSVKVNGSGLSGVAISAGSASTSTDVNGNYLISNLVNGIYQLTPLLTGYTFTPASISTTVAGANIQNQNFSATLIQAPIILNEPTNIEQIFSVNFDQNPTGIYSQDRLTVEWNLGPLTSVNGIAEGRVSVAQDVGIKVISVKYPFNSCGPKDTDGCKRGGGAQWLMPLSQNYEELFLTYKVKFGTGFGFVNVGKLPGLTGGSTRLTPPPTGGGKPLDCGGFSARFMWNSNGAGETYLYSPKQVGEFGDHLYWFNPDGSPFIFIPGQWYRITEYIKMNTPGLADGKIDIYVDRVRVSRKTDAYLRGSACPGQGINQFYFSTFFGGDDPSYAASKDETTYFDDFEISRPLN